jgi:hypothetical protein
LPVVLAQMPKVAVVMAVAVVVPVVFHNKAKMVDLEQRFKEQMVPVRVAQLQAVAVAVQAA